MMKSKRILIATLATTSIAALLALNPITINAATKSVNTTQIQKNDKQYVIKNSPELSKWGYIVNVNSSEQPVFVGKDSYEKMLNNQFFKGSKVANPKKIKNVRFKIVKTMTFKNANGGTPQYLITSKNHKYNAWTTDGELRYYAINRKALKAVVKPLKRIHKRNYEGLHNLEVKNKHDFNLAVKAAKKLKGNQRKFILASLNQMKKDSSTENDIGNILAWSVGGSWKLNG